MTCLKNIQKNRDKIIKYCVLIANLLYIIGLSITSIALNGERSLNKELIGSFTAPIISLIIAFVKTESVDLNEITKTFKKHLKEADDKTIDINIEDIITTINSSRSINIEPAQPEQPTTTEPTDEDITVMNAYYNKKTHEFIKLTPRVHVPRIPEH